jgi:hypothetical protein
MGMMTLKQFQEFFESQGGLMFLMFVGVVFFSSITLTIIIWAPKDDKAFLLFSNLISGCASSLWTAARVSHKDPVDPAISSNSITTLQEKHEADPPKEGTE